MKKIVKDFLFYMLLYGVYAEGNPGVMRSIKVIEDARTIRNTT